MQFIRDMDNVGMRDTVQGVMAEEARQVGKQFPAAGRQTGAGQQGFQEKSRLCGVHPAAPAFMMPQGLVQEPDVRSEEGEMIRLGNKDTPDFFRQRGEQLPAEGYVNYRIRHIFPPFTLIGPRFSIPIFPRTDKDICPDRVCDI